jgi:hypothetical protein
MTQNVNTVTNDRTIQMNEVMSKPRLDAILYLLLGSTDLVQKWWVTPNTAFDDRFPKDVYYQDPNGRQEISDYISAYADGSYK